MKNIVLIVASFCTFSCVEKIKTTVTGPSETIVFGKLSFESSKPLKKFIRMDFNYRISGKNSVIIDDNGYFYMKLPLGYNFISVVENGEYYKSIYERYISVNVPLADKVYYVGDISMEWTPCGKDRRKGGTIGVIKASKEIGVKIPVTVKATEASIKYFKEKFPDNQKEIVTSLITIEN
jgi:hypothetical protein